MKFSFIAVLALIGTLIGAACSTVSDDKPQANAATNANSGVSVNSGDYAGEPQPADANTSTPADAVNSSSGNLIQSKLDKMRKSGTAGQDFGDVEAMALKTGRPAPDDSIYASYLTDAGYEVRSFRNHPQILKVVKRIDGDNQSLKVYLRNGRVVDIPVQKVTSLATVSVSVILEAAGIRPLPPPPGPPARPAVPGKKPEN